MLRVLVGESAAGATTERIVTIECEIDDMNPQLFGVALTFPLTKARPSQLQAV